MIILFYDQEKLSFSQYLIKKKMNV